MTSNIDDMFPPSPREIYSKAPLVEVICQLKFPSLLRIEGEVPAQFQERIRSIFPLFERGSSPMPPQLPPEILQFIRQQVSAVTYQFLTEDRVSTVTLSPDSLALTTTKYERWERFFDQLRAPMAALVDIYQPSFFSRIGLRYIDAIMRGPLGLQDKRWSELLRQEILGELAVRSFEDNLESVSRMIRVRIPDGSGSVLWRHGLAQVQGHDEVSYSIDLDFFTEKRTEVKDAEPTLNYFNELAGRAFRRCITDTLRDALGPSELASTG